MVVPPGERKGWEPAFATSDPAFVSRHKWVGVIEYAQVDLDLVRAAGENGRAAARTEKPPGIVARLTFDGDRFRREHGRSEKEGAMMLAAVEAMANADPARISRRDDPDVPAQATACELVHVAPPFLLLTS
jgi:hypothetical protein